MYKLVAVIAFGLAILGFSIWQLAQTGWPQHLHFQPKWDIPVAMFIISMVVGVSGGYVHSKKSEAFLLATAALLFYGSIVLALYWNWSGMRTWMVVLGIIITLFSSISMGFVVLRSKRPTRPDLFMSIGE